MLGFYAYLPDITVWLRMQPNFPLKNSLLELDSQTLQLIVFTCLLFLILAKVILLSFSNLSILLSFKLYIAAVIWYCYGYITALNMARSIGIVTTFSDVHTGGVRIDCLSILWNIIEFCRCILHRNTKKRLNQTIIRMKNTLHLLILHYFPRHRFRFFFYFHQPGLFS